MSAISRLCVVANRTVPEGKAALQRAAACAAQAGAELLLDADTAAWAQLPAAGADMPAVAAKAQLCLVFGGDGTFLRAARLLEDQPIPLLGINMGGLGFLTLLRLADMEDALRPILAGEFRIEKRMRLEATVKRQGGGAGPVRALNDAVIHMSQGSRLIDFRVSVGGLYLGGYRSDGLIVATPTGSTAYSMSAGGPIVHPTMDALVATPISPHALSIRPILVGGEEEIGLRVGERSGEAVLTMDGAVTHAVYPGDEIVIRRSAADLPFLLPSDFDYYGLVREKLGWGRIGEED